MIVNMSKHITQKLIDYDIINFDDFEVYLYGLQLLLTTVFEIVGIFILGFYLGWVKEVAIFLIVFGLLRTQAGGYHANSVLSCFVFTSLFTFICIVIVKNVYISNSLVFISLILLISILLVFKYAPKDTPNKPLSKKEYEKYKKNSRLLVLLLSVAILSISLIYKSLSAYCSIAALAVLAESLTLIKNKKREEVKI